MQTLGALGIAELHEALPYQICSNDSTKAFGDQLPVGFEPLWIRHGSFRGWGKHPEVEHNVEKNKIHLVTKWSIVGQGLEEFCTYLLTVLLGVDQL